MPEQRANPARRLRPTADVPSRRKCPASGRRDHVEGAWQVSDDLPRPTPIGRAEVEVLETYLGAQIDDILRRMRP